MNYKGKYALEYEEALNMFYKYLESVREEDIPDGGRYTEQFIRDNPGITDSHHPACMLFSAFVSIYDYVLANCGVTAAEGEAGKVGTIASDKHYLS